LKEKGIFQEDRMPVKIQIVCPHCSVTNRVERERLGDRPKCGKCKQALFYSSPVELTAGNFAQNISNNEIPIIIDFWAPWCGPCKMMAPIFHQAAAQLEPNFRLGKVNTEAEPMIARQFGIQSIPTTVLLKKGKEMARQVGAMDLRNLVSWARSNS
jgi:thioredoxin 2